MIRRRKKKHKYYNIEQAGIYTVLALVLAVVGVVKSSEGFLWGAVVVGACAFYWIWKGFVEK